MFTTTTTTSSVLMRREILSWLLHWRQAKMGENYSQNMLSHNCTAVRHFPRLRTIRAHLPPCPQVFTRKNTGKITLTVCNS
jgi:hypothetical protein